MFDLDCDFFPCVWLQNPESFPECESVQDVLHGAAAAFVGLQKSELAMMNLARTRGKETEKKRVKAVCKILRNVLNKWLV